MHMNKMDSIGSSHESCRSERFYLLSRHSRQLEMDLSSAVQWWETSQMRVLVLSSLAVQYFLLLAAPQRKLAIPSWFRSLIWLAYLGSDGLAIYALAALFNRHRDQGSASAHRSILEVVWAPVLLIHLGGLDSITAISVEDNELWKRHILTSVSQVTIAIYVFSKSWPGGAGGDKRLLQTAILLFVPGILKCFEKPFALKRASINSLVSSPNPAARTDGVLLEGYVEQVGRIIREQQRQEDISAESHDVEAAGFVPWAQRRVQRNEEIRSLRLEDRTLKVFVDHASAYPDRLEILRSFSVLGETKAYELLQNVITNTFDALYTKAKLTSLQESVNDGAFLNNLADNIRIANIFLTFAAIGLFHNSHREVYNDDDVKVTYTLICCTAVLGLITHNGRLFRMRTMVAQYSLVGFFARNRRHAMKMCIVRGLGCKDFLDQHWCMESFSSSRRITKLVLGGVRLWWRQHIVDVASYRRFNDSRGQWTIRHVQDGHDLLSSSLKRSFDESVLLWHIATDLCFYFMGHASPDDHRCASSSQSDEDHSSGECATWCKRSQWFGRAMGCKEMSNYMMYLLFVNPEMLIAGARRNLFTAAYAQLSEIVEGSELPLEERALTQAIITKMESLPEPQEAGNFIHDAWKLADGLVKLGDEMWEVIEGVWVEMLCFSASRGRGYLHAKALGNGGELLTYIWLLLYHMGMETLTERLQREDLSTEEGHASQREDHPSGGENTGASPSTS